MKAHFFERSETDDCEAGWTVSKKPELPVGDFSITEYSWPGVSLWFVDADKFNADERHAMFLGFCDKKEQEQ